MSQNGGYFPVADSKATSEAWLREFCDTHDCPSYDTVIGALNGTWPTGAEADDWCGFEHEGEWLLFRGIDAHASIPPEFWDHIETVTGRTFERATHFSCSC